MGLSPVLRHFRIVAVLRLCGAAASPNPRKANATSMRLYPIPSEVVSSTLLRYASVIESVT